MMKREQPDLVETHRNSTQEVEDKARGTTLTQGGALDGFPNDGNNPTQRQQNILAMQRTQGNAAVQRHLAGRVQREVHSVPTSAVGLIVRFDRASIINNYCQIQADNMIPGEPLWIRSGLAAQLQTILSGPGYWEGHRTWSPREAVVDLGTFSDNVGISLSIELLQDNENILGSRGRVGLQSQSSGQTSFENSSESSQSGSVSGSAGSEGRGSVSVGAESSNTQGAGGGLELGGQQQATVNSRNSTGVTADLFVRVTISMRRFNRFGSNNVGTQTNVIRAGTIEYVDPTHQRNVAIPRAPHRLPDRRRH